MMKIMDSPQTVSIREAMALLDLSRPTILKYMYEGRFPHAVKAAGQTGEWLLARDDVEAVRAARIAELQAEIDKLVQLGKRK